MTSSLKSYLLLIVLVLVAIDQWTKAWIMVNLPLYFSLEVIEGFFNLTHVRNPGGAFGLLACASEVWRIGFFLVLTLLVLVMLTWYFHHDPQKTRFKTLAMGLVIGGGCGNLIDRIRFGYVVDFLDVYVGSFHWPTFNVADAAISTGAILLFVILVKEGKVKR